MALYLDPLTAAAVAQLNPQQEVTLLGFDVVKVANVPTDDGMLAVLGLRTDSSRSKFWGFEFTPVDPEVAAEMELPELLLALFGAAEFIEIQRVAAQHRVEYEKR